MGESKVEGRNEGRMGQREWAELVDRVRRVAWILDLAWMASDLAFEPDVSGMFKYIKHRS